MSDYPQVTIYTDGGCIPNPGTGGWAAILQYGKYQKELSGGELKTTNNRMELMAAIQGLASLKKPCQVKLITDSEYLRKGITEWLPVWREKGWKRKKGELKNIDLWQMLDSLIKKHHIDWEWVKGHSGAPLNERCDFLVKQAILSLQSKANL